MVVSASASVRRAGFRRAEIFVLAPLLLQFLSSCTPGSTPLVKLHGVPAGSFEAQLDQACGTPIVYPLSPKCIGLMGSAGPMLQHRSDLVMRIWRSCPEDNPCYKITKENPACAGAAPLAVADHGGGPHDPCVAAQEADYSCASLRNDLVYLERIRQAPPPQEADADCMEDKKGLVEYDKKIEEMSVRIQWYRIFAEKGY